MSGRERAGLTRPYCPTAKSAQSVVTHHKRNRPCGSCVCPGRRSDRLDETGGPRRADSISVGHRQSAHRKAVQFKELKKHHFKTDDWDETRAKIERISPRQFGIGGRRVSWAFSLFSQ